MQFIRGKKKLTQDDLRKAMNDHKKKMGVVKKIESPLAKYTDSGQLICILCKSIVRNEAVWSVHLNSKTHRENISLTKKARTEPENIAKPVTVALKRPSSPSTPHASSKKVKGILRNSCQPHPKLPADFFDEPASQVQPAPRNVVSNNNDERKKEGPRESQECEEVEMEEEKDGTKEINQPPLPEGFFDDPIMDAKVRNVEYKDPIEEEWEKFQKEIKEEAAQSAQIIADDQEEATTERQLDEIEEQMRHWSRVLELERRKEQVQATEKKSASVDEDLSSADEVEFDEFLDWRAKKSYK